MSKGTVATEPAEPVCRLVSLRNGQQSAASREAKERTIELRSIAAGITIVGLLVLAAMGLVFNAKQHRSKPEAPATDVVVNEPVKHSATSHQPIFIEPKPNDLQPAVTPIADPLPPTIVEIVPTVTEPELVAQPREIDPRPMPIPVVMNEKPDIGPAGATTRGPDLPAATIPDAPKEKPVVQAPQKLLDTEPAIDPRLPTFGTKVGFHPNIAEAIEAAQKNKDKLLMVVHYAGLFENGAFVADAVEAFRQSCLLNPEVAGVIQQNFICSATKIATSRNDGTRNTGSVVVYFCRADGYVLHAVPGPLRAEEFLKEMQWMFETHTAVVAEAQKDSAKYGPALRKAHMDRYFETGGEDTVVPGLTRNPPVQPKMNFLPKGPPGFMGKFPPGFLPMNLGQGPPAFAPVVQPPKLPAKLPAELMPQTKVHWLLAKQSLTQVKDVYHRIYVDYLGEKIGPPQ